jgi:hypothetical protein
MRISATGLGAGLTAFVVVATSAGAFEPGAEHVCVPSADGQRFECSETSPAAPEIIELPRKDSPVPAPRSAPVETVTAAPAETRELDHVPADPPARPASRLPPYLMQSPASGARPSASQVRAPTPAPNPLPAPEATPATATISEPASAPAQSEATRAQSAPAESVDASPAPAAIDAHAAAPRPVAPAASQPSPSVDTLQDSREFAALASGHYTVVLASTRNRAQLDDLIATMQAVPGNLYLLRLDMPDGAWYSLCWSEFDDVDAARAARSRLPDHVALTSGWPRRIGLLQAEISR